MVHPVADSLVQHDRLLTAVEGLGVLAKAGVIRADIVQLPRLAGAVAARPEQPQHMLGRLERFPQLCKRGVITPGPAEGTPQVAVA